MPVARCVLLALFLAIEICAAPRSLTIRGQVSHARMFTKVSLFADGSDNAPLVTYCNRKGRFSFSVPEGTYTLYVNVKGIGCATRTVIAHWPLAHDKGTITVGLQSSDFNSLQELRQHDFVVSVSQLSSDPYLPPREFGIAQQYLTNGQLEKARALLENIVTSAPKFVPAWDELAYAAVVSGHYVWAEADYLKALAANAKDFTALLGMAHALMQRNLFADALPYHRRAVAERPSNPVAQARLGLNYYELGDLKAAETCLLSAERLDPSSYTRPQLLLAEIYFHESEETAASNQLAEYLKHFPGEEEAAAAVRERAKALHQSLSQERTLIAGQ